ncbi:IS1182 family transposase [Paenibacillus thiaminolyticus]|uniref:IS1182 family transposase n=1 Tax=Paenibacillus thiaminolyticus TaxID=49283 RepID=UPI00232C5257|nr:IS1182 family transposase [Paenibacillus thiaminolyticus]WCF11077.1 IS1182 family transposase [Paenibacillus thiaminolyticus]WCF11082.1 IS1182 family transposase [Paenibacillus thiaminolyticus]WII35441.1 IS1182 family transposase [Paenibacillus thiaminolyticus]WII40495.1 IS1182 family transposase [Paenibacillus thiaminolyticus]
MYIQYNMNQLCLPMDLEEDIPANHLVRMINQAVDRLDDQIFASAYPGGGRHSYHPKMLTKIIIYAYTQRIYSSRQIAKAVRENIPFMWLAARQRPDFRTINRFRSERMQDVLEQIFTSILGFLVEENYVKLEHYFVDGTKIEANANKYTFVWGKAVVKHKAKLQDKVKTLFASIEEAERQEEQELQGQDLRELGESSEVTSEKLEQAVEHLEQKLQKQPKNKPLKKAVRLLRKDLLPRLQKYEHHQEVLGERNSYSKTDPDATFMRMKEDHMKNGQLKPGYNVQIGTENQFVVGYSLHQRPTDTRCMKPHLEKVKNALGKLPGTIIADAGYGSEENYAYLEEESVEAIVKYSTYHQEKSKKWKQDVSKIDNWEYNEQTDTWTCPGGQVLGFRYESKQKNESGYEIKLRHYRSQDCSNCPLKAACTKAKGNREIRVSMKYLRYKQQAREKLRSEEGYALSVRRMVEPESVFGQMKNNRGFRRFLLRGLSKVSLEVGWLSLAHNLLKWAVMKQKGRVGEPV